MVLWVNSDVTVTMPRGGGPGIFCLPSDLMTLHETMDLLQRLGDEASASGMARFGITGNEVLGIRMPVLRGLAREIGRNHTLAQQLWDTGVHEARLLAVLIGDPRELTESLMDLWVGDFDSWDICDQACINLFIKSSQAYEKAAEWTARAGEFEKRAGFAMMAALAVHDKRALDARFIGFLPLICEHAVDGRNFVKKAVSWALRQIGKRNGLLRELAIQSALRIRTLESRPARWIASEALRELNKPSRSGK